jgi:hypothetical protein
LRQSAQRRNQSEACPASRRHKHALGGIERELFFGRETERDDKETHMPRINIRYDSSLVDGADLATLMAELAEMGARQYFTTPEKVVVELFEQSPYTLGHRTLDVEINALPDPEGSREGQIESFALEMVNFLAKWLQEQGVAGNVGAETRLFASGAFAWAPSGGEAELTHSSFAR